MLVVCKNKHTDGSAQGVPGHNKRERCHLAAQGSRRLEIGRRCYVRRVAVCLSVPECGCVAERGSHTRVKSFPPLLDDIN